MTVAGETKSGKAQGSGDLTAFDRHWVAVARTTALEGKGAFRTVTIGVDPIVVLRNGKDELRAHLNVCRHRGSQILEGCGHIKSLMCPYHGWLYSLDGELRGAPEMKYSESFDKSKFPLVSFQATEWAGFALVGIDPDALEPAGNELDEAYTDVLASCTTADSWTSTVGGGWRQVLSGIAGRNGTDWTISAGGGVLAAHRPANGNDAVFLVRPNLLLISHRTWWTALSVVPGADDSAAVTGYCLIPATGPDRPSGNSNSSGNRDEIAYSKSVTTTGGDGPGTAELPALLDTWLDSDRQDLSTS